MEAKRLTLQMRDPRGYQQREPGKCFQGCPDQNALVNTLIDILSCPELLKLKQVQGSQPRDSLEQPQTDAGCQVLECANKDELMRDLSETQKPYSAPTGWWPSPYLGNGAFGNSVAGAFVLLCGKSLAGEWLCRRLITADDQTWVTLSQTKAREITLSSESHDSFKPKTQ